MRTAAQHEDRYLLEPYQGRIHVGVFPPTHVLRASMVEIPLFIYTPVPLPGTWTLPSHPHGS